MKEGKYAKTLVKILVTTIFLMRDMLRSFFTQIFGDYAGAHPYGHQHSGRKPKETFVTEFCYKSVNLSLEEL